MPLVKGDGHSEPKGEITSIARDEDLSSLTSSKGWSYSLPSYHRGILWNIQLAGILPSYRINSDSAHLSHIDFIARAFNLYGSFQTDLACRASSSLLGWAIVFYHPFLEEQLARMPTAG